MKYTTLILAILFCSCSKKEEIPMDTVFVRISGTSPVSGTITGRKGYIDYMLYEVKYGDTAIQFTISKHDQYNFVFRSINPFDVETLVIGEEVRHINFHHWYKAIF